MVDRQPRKSVTKSGLVATQDMAPLRLLAAVAALSGPTMVFAQAPPEPPPPDMGRTAEGGVVFAGEVAVRVTNEWDPAAGTGGQGHVRLRAGARRQRIPLASPAMVSAAATASGVFLAVLEDRPTRLLAVHVPLVEGRFGEPVTTEVTRPGGEALVPMNLTATATPTGYAVFWQEVPSTQPGATWQTFEARFDARGAAEGASRALGRVPWPIAAAAFVGGRYFLALWFAPGGRPDQIRLAAVHVDLRGSPQEHPWWASRPGLIGETQLVVNGERVLAVYRGGSDGGQLLEVDVTTGRWGQEPSAPRRRGRIGAMVAYGVRARGTGTDVERFQLD